MASDEALVEGCVRNDRASQEALYNRYCRRMLMLCQRYTRTSEEAEDVLQEGFIKVFTHIRSFKKESRLETWMTRIFINAALNHQRQKLYLFPMVEISESSMTMPVDVNLSELHVNELLAMIKTLPDGCRMVFNMFAIEGYSHRDIAEMMNISEGTSKSQYNRAKMLLRDRLQEYRNEYGKLGESKF